MGISWQWIEIMQMGMHLIKVTPKLTLVCRIEWAVVMPGSFRLRPKARPVSGARAQRSGSIAWFQLRAG